MSLPLAYIIFIFENAESREYFRKTSRNRRNGWKSSIRLSEDLPSTQRSA
jgi:hypothetical protein